MKCAEFHEQAGAYALDALEEDERIACALHLADEGPHEGCEALLARYASAVEALAHGVADEPVVAGVWQAIAARIGAPSVTPAPTPQVAPPITPREPTRVTPRGTTQVVPREAPRELLPRLTIAVALVAAAAGLVAALYGHHDVQVVRRQLVDTQAQLTSSGSALARAEAERLACAALLERARDSSALARDAVSMLEDGATRVAPMTPSGTRQVRATALYNPSTKRALAVSSTMQPIAGKDYALWVIAGSDPPRPAGFLRFDARGVALGEFDPALLAGAQPSALAISLEQAGGAPAPTEVLLIAKLGG